MSLVFAKLANEKLIYFRVDRPEHYAKSVITVRSRAGHMISASRAE